MEFKDLCGVRTFSAIEVSEDLNQYNEKVNVVLFELDGVTYIAKEDPDDGYRSYCAELELSGVRPAITFPGVKVLCRMKQDELRERHDVLQCIDVSTGMVVLEIGTANTDDYYPYWHFEYHPENMIINSTLPGEAGL